MKTLLRISILLCSCFIAAPTMAAIGSSQGTVQQTWTYGNGMMLVGGFNFSGATCSNNGGFVIPATHPQFSRLMAVILAAKASGAVLTVVAKIDNCWYPEITTDSSTYIYTAP